MSNFLDKYEFINFVIGEGTEESWKSAIGDENRYQTLMAREDEKISDTIANNLANMSDEDLFKFVKHHYPAVVIESLQDLKMCHDCEVIVDWSSSHPTNGHIWECESCGEHICSKCIESEINGPIPEDMDIICPSCINNSFEKLDLNTHVFSNIKIGDVFVVNAFPEDNAVDFQLEIISNEIPNHIAGFVSVYINNKDIENATIFLYTREVGELLYNFTNEEEINVKNIVRSHISKFGWGNY